VTATIELLGYQRTTAEIGSVDFPTGDGQTVLDALNHIALLYPAMALDPDRVIFNINGERSPADSVLKAGDIIRFLPIIGGG